MEPQSGVVSSPLSFPSGEGGEGGAERGSAGAAVTRLVSPLEAFDGRKTERGRGRGGLLARRCSAASL